MKGYSSGHLPLPCRKKHTWALTIQIPRTGRCVLTREWVLARENTVLSQFYIEAISKAGTSELKSNNYRDMLLQLLGWWNLRRAGRGHPSICQGARLMLLSHIRLAMESLATCSYSYCLSSSSYSLSSGPPNLANTTSCHACPWWEEDVILLKSSFSATGYMECFSAIAASTSS